MPNLKWVLCNEHNGKLKDLFKKNLLVIMISHAAYQKYQQRMGHELDDEMMQNILLRKLPPKFEQSMRMNIQLVGKETSYASLRLEIIDMCVHYVGPSARPWT